MKIDNLKEGMVIKNYKELCALLEIKPTGGNVKKAQIDGLKRFCDFSKQGYKFIINKIYETPKAKKNRKIEDYKEFKVVSRFNFSTGVYIIKQNSKIYIGSTIAGFRRRFLQHYNNTSKYNSKTTKMLHNGGTFSILCAEGLKDEPLLREIEKECIKLFKYNTDYIVVNRNNPFSYTEQKHKPKYKTIKIDKSNYKDVIKFLEENYISYK